MRFSDRRISASRTKGWLRLTAAAIAVLASAARADDLGVIGPVYPIAEKDLLAWIETRLRAKERSGELAAMQAQAKKRAIESIEEPRPVANLGKAQRARTYYYDPSVVVPYAITDDAGRVLVAAGTRVNPLDTVTLSRRLLFFDARDPRQVRTAKALIEAEGGRVKPIVTGGSYMNLMRHWKVAVFYDQEGVLVRKLGIHAVPALVSQEGKRLRIDELPQS